MWREARPSENGWCLQRASPHTLASSAGIHRLWTCLCSCGQGCTIRYACRLGMAWADSWKRLFEAARKTGVTCWHAQASLREDGWPGPTPRCAADGTPWAARDADAQAAHELLSWRAYWNTRRRMGADVSPEEREARRAQSGEALRRAGASASSQPSSPSTAALGVPDGQPKSQRPSLRNCWLKERSATASVALSTRQEGILHTNLEKPGKPH